MKSTILHAIIWISICVTALIGHWFWYATIESKSAAVANLQNQIDKKEESIARTASARATLAEIATDEAEVQSYFVPETGVVTFINDIEGRAQKQGSSIKVLSVSLGDLANQPTLVLTLVISGTFDAVMRTVGAVEYAPYDLSIPKISLGKGEKNAWHADVEILVGSVPAGSATSTQATAQKVISSSFIP